MRDEDVKTCPWWVSNLLLLCPDCIQATAHIVTRISNQTNLYQFCTVKPVMCIVCYLGVKNTSCQSLSHSVIGIIYLKIANILRIENIKNIKYIKGINVLKDINHIKKNIISRISRKANISKIETISSISGMAKCQVFQGYQGGQNFEDSKYIKDIENNKNFKL